MSPNESIANLQNNLDDKADAKLKKAIEAAVPFIPNILDRGYTDSKLMVKPKTGEKGHNTLQPNDVVRHLRKVLFDANQKAARREEVALFVGRMDEIQDQVDDLSAGIQQ
jgi:hypothetical protein